MRNRLDSVLAAAKGRIEEALDCKRMANDRGYREEMGDHATREHWMNEYRRHRDVAYGMVFGAYRALDLDDDALEFVRALEATLADEWGME